MKNLFTYETFTKMMMTLIVLMVCTIAIGLILMIIKMITLL